MLLLVSGGAVLWLLNLAVGFSCGDNLPSAVVGPMIWGAVCASGVRWARL